MKDIYNKKIKKEKCEYFKNHLNVNQIIIDSMDKDIEKVIQLYKQRYEKVLENAIIESNIE